MPQVGSTFNHFFTPGPMMHTIVGPDPAVGSPLGVVPQTIVPQKLPRSDRLEVCIGFRFIFPRDTPFLIFVQVVKEEIYFIFFSPLFLDVILPHNCNCYCVIYNYSVEKFMHKSYCEIFV